jgi:hypothetical protein
MIIIIILIVLAGVVYLIVNSLAQNTNTTTIPNINLLNTIITSPRITTPFVNPIPNLLLIKGDLNLFYRLNKMSDNIDSESRTISNLTWNKDTNIIINPVDNDENKLAAQFRFFAEFWLNKLNINSGFTNVYDLTGNIGRFDFTRNDTIYTGKFNGVIWNWDTIDYCFNTVNSKRQNKCLGGWIYNKDNGKCYPPLNSTSKCDNYDYKTMYNYTDQNNINDLMIKCNLNNSPNCTYPRPGQLITQLITPLITQIPSTILSNMSSTTTMPPTTISSTTTIPPTTISSTTTMPPVTVSPTPPPLYPFTTHTFTSAGIIGRLGPNLATVRNAYSNASWTKNNDFFNMYNDNGIQVWTVPETGIYTIRAVGAGIPYIDALTSSGLNKYQKGIDLTIKTKLIKGEKINILVGQISTYYSKQGMGNPAMGGAGGTFVVKDKNIPIIVAGGGGGRGAFQAVETSNATDSESGQTSKGPFDPNYYRGGKDGSGGKNSNYGAGGGGFFGGGASTVATFPSGNYSAGEANATGGEAFISGGKGGYGGSVNHSNQKYYLSSDGGFGGGGGAFQGGGGGGGGYSGGASGEYDGPNLKDGNFNWTSGGGGGSYSITGLFDLAVVNNNDNGFVVITANF